MVVRPGARLIREPRATVPTGLRVDTQYVHYLADFSQLCLGRLSTECHAVPPHQQPFKLSLILQVHCETKGSSASMSALFARL